MSRFLKTILFSALIFLFLATACGGGQRIGINVSDATALAAQPTTQAGTDATQVTTSGLTGTAEIPETGATVTVVGPSLNITRVAPPAAGIPVTGMGTTSVLCQFCVDQIPHAVVLLPQAATFSKVSANGSPITSDGQSACNAVETLNGKQVVICFGAAGATINLNVCTDGSNCALLPVKMSNCPAAQSAGPSQAIAPTATPTSGTIPTPTPLP